VVPSSIFILLLLLLLLLLMYVCLLEAIFFAFYFKYDRYT